MKAAFDVLIVGAGPAGTATALGLHGSGLKVALIDKSTFPRDKICGDAISPDVVNQLGQLPVNIQGAFAELKTKITADAVRFISPDYSAVDMSLKSEDFSGYVSPRLAFDHFLYKEAIAVPEVTPFVGQRITSLVRDEQGINITLDDGTVLTGAIVIGADGTHSLVKRTLQREAPDKDHYCAGLRIYYEGVTGFSDENAVELHFYTELLPGYFWMFPLPDGKANIGIGMLTSHIQKNDIKLREKLLEIISTHPNVAPRFEHAKPLEKPQGFPLPLGSKKRKISGDRYLLLGDAASLINPLSGEGIANAIRSGRVAADHLRNAFAEHRFDTSFNRAYDKEVYRRMWGELRLNYWVQRFMRNPKRCNWLVKHAIGHPLVREMVMSGFDAKNIFKRQMVS